MLVLSSVWEECMKMEKVLNKILLKQQIGI